MSPYSYSYVLAMGTSLRGCFQLWLAIFIYLKYKIRDQSILLLYFLLFFFPAILFSLPIMLNICSSPTNLLQSLAI